MTTTPTTIHGAPESVLMPWPATHYGCRVVELGEDGGMWAVAGPFRGEHVADRRAVAAVLHYLRTDCSFTRQDVAELVGQFRNVDRRWVTAVDDDDEPWQWADAQAQGASAVTFVESY